VRKDANLRQRNTCMTQHHSAELLFVNCALPALTPAGHLPGPDAAVKDVPGLCTPCGSQGASAWFPARVLLLFNDALW
jgi:hypothetical protein